MRNELVAMSSPVISYEIRNIVSVAEKLQKYGVIIDWENIGDPIAKGEIIPQWMKEIACNHVHENRSWGYTHSRGDLKTREFLAARTNSRGGAQITLDDIIFFNGLGDAITKIYTNLKPQARILMPSPTYTTHSIAEAHHASSQPLQYCLQPENQWMPDLANIENQVKYNPQIVGIMLINPDNPTGMVYNTETLASIVDIAKRYDLFIISDEVYINIVYNGKVTCPISDLIGDVPAISMKGISKEFPWPGARCGWIEVYNAGKDPHFDRYINNILKSKLNEVCSTTLPQRCIPEIMSHTLYPSYLQERINNYEASSIISSDILSKSRDLIVNPCNGAFYMSVVFSKGSLSNTQTLPIEQQPVKELVTSLVNTPDTMPDKRFVYYLLASTGICVVPLSSFSTKLQGFRVTLLEKDVVACKRIYDTIAKKIDEYTSS